MISEVLHGPEMVPSRFPGLVALLGSPDQEQSMGTQ